MWRGRLLQMKTLSPGEIAKLLQVSDGTVGSWISNGELAAFVASRSASSRRPRYRVSEEALSEFMARRSVVPPAAPVRRRRKNADDQIIKFYG
jgi:excisionase family DNA binding protein